MAKFIAAKAEPRALADRTLEVRPTQDLEATLGFGPRQSLALLDLAQLELALGNRSEALKLLDGAHVGAVAGLGMRHPRVVATTLARADLAWALGQRSYAERLYGVAAGDLEQQRGADDPDTIRANARRSAPDK